MKLPLAPRAYGLALVNLAAIALLSVLSCNKQPPLEPTPSTQQEDKGMATLIAAGYNADHIVPIDIGYLIGEDFVLTHEHVDALANGPKQRIYGPNYIISLPNQTDIKVWNDGLSADWGTALTNAMAAWNSMPNCNISFSVGSALDYDTRVYSYNTGASCAQAVPGSAGLPGAWIRCHPSHPSMPTVDQKTETLFHELGHVLGFAHTNDITYPQIIGTANQQNSSCMYAFTCSEYFSAHQPTYFDKLAYALIYPEVAPPAGSADLYAYTKTSPASATDNIYNTDWSELGGEINAPATSFNYRGILVRVMASSVAGTIALKRYYNSVAQKHYYTTSTGGIPPGYTLVGTVGYVYSASAPGLVPLYRHRVSGFYVLSRLTGAALATVYGAAAVSGSALVGYVHPAPIQYPHHW